jgi:tetrahydromethanopterin S-methyltransferase subunit E
MSNLAPRTLRRKSVIALWILTMLALSLLLFLTLWSHFYMPDIFESVKLAGIIAIPVAFVLMLVMLVLNRWKPLRQNPYK